MENPFNYLQFATGDRFYDREEIRRDLRSRLLSGQTNVVLYGPRRYGKSSLVAELTADLEQAGHIEQFESECWIADPFFAEFLRSV